MNKIGAYTFSLLFAVTLLFLSAVMLPAAVSSISGLAVAAAPNKWNDVKDYGAGDGVLTGVLAAGMMFWNGSAADRVRGSVANGIQVDVTRIPTSGTAFFSVKRDNISAASVNLAFGLTSKKIAIRAPFTNTDEICVSYTGGTAVCPAANTAGNSRIAPGGSIILDDFSQTSLSIIANSGTQTVYVDAWN